MNRNELKRMLSEVEEQYISEIVDDEETTSDVTMIRRTNHFGRWAAIAAAVCLCVVGGGVALGRMQQNSFADNPNSEVEELPEFDLIRESIPKELCIIDYTWEAGGENFKCSSPMLPFADSNFDEVRSTFFCDENGDAVNFYAHLKNGEKSIQLTISDRGHLFPNNFFLDLSEDANRQKPAIHIYEMSRTSERQKFELYYLHGGIGMSMETSGYTEEEAVAFAASLLRNNVTSKSLWEAANAEFDYEVIHEPLPEPLLELSYTLEQEYGNVSTSFTPSLPFEMTGFTSASAICYLDSDSIVHNTFVNLLSEKGRVSVTLSDFEELFSTRVSPDVSTDAQYKKPVIHMYEHPVYESKPNYELFCVYNGVGLSMETSGYTAKEAEAFAAALLQNGTTAKEFAFRDHYGFEKVEETIPERKYIEHDPNLHGDMKKVDTPVLPFDAALFDTDASFGFDENGEPVYAFIGFCYGDSATVRLFVDDRGRLYNEDYEVDFSADAKLNYPRVHFYDLSEEMGGEYTERYDFYCRYGDIGYTVLSSDCSFSEVGDNILGSLLKNGATAKSLYEASMNGEIPTESPTEEKGLFGLAFDELPQVCGDIYETRFTYILDDYSLPFAVGGEDYTGHGNVQCTSSDSPFYAQIYLSNGYEKTIDIRMSQEEGMFGDTPIPENGGVEYRDVTLYGHSNLDDSTLIVTFVLDGTGYTLESHNMPQEDLFAFVDAIIDNHYTIQGLPLDENNTYEYVDLERLQTHEIFGFMAPEHAEIGELRLWENDISIIREPNTETDSPEIIHSCIYQYANDIPEGNATRLICCEIENTLINPTLLFKEEPPHIDAASITEETLRRDGQPREDGLYVFTYIIPMGEYYVTLYAKCTIEEMWTFCKEVLQK